jgi:photosystem II stability/assembly factor-like uncharacterized protein
MSDVRPAPASGQNTDLRKVLLIVAAVWGACLLCSCVAAVIAVGSLYLAEVGGAGDGPMSEPPSPYGHTEAVGTWQALGDLPRRVNAVVADPSDLRVLYAATGNMEAGGGVYKSTDGGRSWMTVNSGLPDELVAGLAISDDGAVLYAATGVSGAIYASRDGAQSWRQVGDNPELCCNVEHHLYVVPGNPQALFAVQPAADENLSYSSDGGKTWTRIADERGPLKAGALAIDPSSPQTLYLGTRGHGVYKSSDGGATWAEANRGMVDRQIVTLVLDPSDRQTLYATTYDGQVFKSTDGAESWDNITERLELETWLGGSDGRIAVHPGSPGLLFLGLSSTGFLLSRDGGETWVHVKMPSEEYGASFSVIAPVSGEQPAVLVCVTDKGAYLYTP